MSGALGLRDELGVADVTIALCEQASIHDARRLHLHLRLHKHTHPNIRKYEYDQNAEGNKMSVNLTVGVRGA